MKLTGMIMGAVFAGIFISQWTSGLYVAPSDIPGTIVSHASSANTPPPPLDSGNGQEPYGPRQAPPNPFAIILLVVGLARIAVGQTRRV